MLLATLALLACAHVGERSGVRPSVDLERIEIDIVCRARELSGLRQAPFEDVGTWIHGQLRSAAPVRGIFAAAALARDASALGAEVGAYAAGLGVRTCPLAEELKRGYTAVPPLAPLAPGAPSRR